MFIPMLLSKLEFINDYGYIYALAGILPLLVVLILGVATNGSKLSFTVLGITIQPSELVKIIFVFCIAALFSKAKNYVDVFITIVIAAIHVLVLVLSKDLGSALIFFVAYIFMMFIFTHNYLFIHVSCLYSRTYGVSSWKFKEAETAVRGEQTIIILKKCGRI